MAHAVENITSPKNLRMFSCYIGMLLVILPVVPIRAVWADAAVRANAMELFNQGTKFMKQRKFDEALFLFSQSNDFQKNDTTIFAIAYCEWRIRHFTHARKLLSVLKENNIEQALLGDINSSSGLEIQIDSPNVLMEDINSKLAKLKVLVDVDNYRQTTTALDDYGLAKDFTSTPNHLVLISAKPHPYFQPKDMKKVLLAAQALATPEKEFEILLDPVDEDGKHAIILRDNTHSPIHRNITLTDIRKGQVSLSHADQTATLIVDIVFEGSEPTAAKPRSGGKQPSVSDVDVSLMQAGRRIFQGKKSIIENIRQGDYALTAKPPGYGFKYEQFEQGHIHLDNGDYLQQKVILRKRPAYRNPWFWVGLLGGAATLSIAIGVGIDQTRDPKFDRGNSNWLVRL